MSDKLRIAGTVTRFPYVIVGIVVICLTGCVITGLIMGQREVWSQALSALMLLTGGYLVTTGAKFLNGDRTPKKANGDELVERAIAELSSSFGDLKSEVEILKIDKCQKAYDNK